MIGKLILTAVIIGTGAFLLLSDSFEAYISPYADAAAYDIENIKNNPEIQNELQHTFDIIYEKFSMMKFSLSDFLE